MLMFMCMFCVYVCVHACVCVCGKLSESVAKCIRNTQRKRKYLWLALIVQTSH